MPVARRLALLLAVPMLATLVFAAWGVVSTSRQARAADRLHDLVAVSAAGGDVIHQLGRERHAAARLLSGAGEGTNGFLEHVAASDRAVEAYRQRRADLDTADRDMARLVAPFDGQLRLLPALREQVASRSVSLTAVLVRYRVMIAQGLAVRETVGQVGGANGMVADQLRVATALSKAAEYAGMQETVVAASAGAPLTPAVQQELAANRAGYDEALLTVADGSPARWRVWLDQALSGPQMLAAQRFDDEIARTRIGQKLRVNRARSAAAGGERQDRLHEVQARVDRDIAATVGDLRTEQWATTVVLSGTALALVLVAGLLTYRQSQGLARRLRRVRDAVTRMAERDLPDLVRRVDEADPADPASIPPAPTAIAPTCGARDEVDEVAIAFDTLALRTFGISTDLARQRRVAAGAVEAVGRRCQGMTHRLMRELDLAERDEADAKTLETLFAVDNLAAQLLHATQSLLVLSGRSLGAVHTEPVDLVTVAQAAQGRIQEYRRVVLGVVDDRVWCPRH
ncbi:nitrate- and nitrite sensing domain-containing protein [Micromonospora sp. NPDC049460]|uniref:nitrate- and nitrite sensing domain-containing protein n=1 Tax=Micromonospora sp. NPDC049460 TaxID=3364272 RepID=UPI0037BA0D12